MTIKEIINEADPMRGGASRMAELIAGGCDYDEMLERLAKQYAEYCGLEEPNDEVYEVADNDIESELEDNTITLAQVLADEEIIAQTKIQMKTYWNELVESGDTALGTMIGMMYDLVYGGCQGWDAPIYSEFEHLAKENGWEIEDAFEDNEVTEQWLKVVQGASMEWLYEAPVRMWGVYMIQHGEDLVDATESDIREFISNEVTTSYEINHPINTTQEMFSWMDGRTRVNIIKEVLKDSAYYEDLLDAIYECIGTAASNTAVDTGFNQTDIRLAFEEIIGIAQNEYTAKEIDEMVAEEAE